MRMLILIVTVIAASSFSTSNAQLTTPQPYVRTHGLAVRPGIGSVQSMQGGQAGSTIAASLPCITLDAIAPHGLAVPGGGTLQPGAFFNSATIEDGGKLAFIADVNGSARNQGVFVADGTTLTPIALGCGGGGGSGAPGAGVGDPTPIGGTFSGFFQGTFFVPALNGAGDVLFMADVDGGAAPRGLFLYVASANQIVAIAAPGDASPLGGTFDAVGPGSLNDGGDVVFLARPSPGANADIFRWSAGVITKVAATGDPAPNGGTYSILGSETVGFVDGSSIPVGPLPSINDAGQIAFRAIAVGGPIARGIVVSTNGVAAWRARVNAPAPGGGTYFDFQGPSLNAAGDVAFFADFKPTPTTFSAGWYVAPTTGPARRALAFFDPIDGGAQCFGLAFSRNPMTPLDDTGNLVVWTDAQFPGGAMQERLVLCRPDGGTSTLVAKSDPTPLGGSFGTLDAWPSLNDVGQSTVSAGTPGAAGGAISTHFRADHVVTWLDLGFALAGTNGEPRLVGAGGLTAGSSGSLQLTKARANAPTFLFFAASASHLPLLGGILVPTPLSNPLALTTAANGTWTLSWPAFPSVPACVDLYLQVWIADPVSVAGAAATNALRGTTR